MWEPSSNQQPQEEQQNVNLSKKKMRLVRDRENLPVATVEITLASDAVR
jgi:hypothetical protein